MKNRSVRRGLILACGFSITFDLPAEMEEITVVGTRVQRADFSSASPVFTISSESIRLDGTQTLSEYLNKSPQFAPAADRTANNPGDGRGEVNLRGLGAKRTLVMLDGQRLGPAGSDGPVDINTIPATLIDRVEVLTGGASAVYGSDAVSGIVNIHLRRDLQGLEVKAGYEVTEEGDGDIWNVSLAGGFSYADGRGATTFFLERTEREEIPTADRPFSSQPLSDDLMGNLIPFGSGATPAGHFPIPATVNGVFSRQGLTFTPDGQPKPYTPADDYNFYSEFNYLQVGLERDTLGAFSTFDFSDRVTGRLDILYSRRNLDQEIAPVPLGLSSTRINLDNPNLTPGASAALAQNYDPSGSGFYTGPFLYRMSGLGGRFSANDRNDVRIAAGVDIDLASGWQASVNYTFTDNDTERTTSNFVLQDRYLQSLLVDPVTGDCFDPSNGCVGGNYFGEGNLGAATADFIRAPDIPVAIFMQQETLQATANGDLDIAGLDISASAGLEWRRDEAGFLPDPTIDLTNIAGLSLQSDAGTIEVTEVFGEIVVPLLDVLTLETGARYSDYSTAGGVFTWKAGLILDIGKTVSLRGMAQSAVRAPNIVEQFQRTQIQENQGGAFGLAPNDPCSASQNPVENGFSEVCIAQGLEPDQLGVYEAAPFSVNFIQTGGNRDLDPEDADTYTIGLVWQPTSIDGLSVVFDYYDISIDNAITEIDNFTVQTLCADSGGINNKFCQAISRDDTGNISLTIAQPQNVATLSTQGLDLQAEYRFPLLDGDFGIALIANHVLDAEIQVDPTSPLLQCAGVFGVPCDFSADGSIPDTRANINLSWERGSISAQLRYRWIDSLRNGALTPGFFPFPIQLAVEETKAEDYIDLSLAWRPTEQVSLVVGVINVAGTEPQLLGFNANQANTNPNLYEVFGRRYHANLTYRF